MINFVQPGDSVTLTAPSGGVVSGTFYQIGQILVCAGATVAETLGFAGKTTGVFTVPKTTGQAWTEGALVYWDDSGKKFTTSSSGNMLAGTVMVAAGSSDATGTVRLNGIGAVNS